MNWQVGNSGFSWANDCDFYKNDIGSVSASSITECANACKKKLACTHFSYRDKICRLKSGLVEKDDALENLDVNCGLLENQNSPRNYINPLTLLPF